MPAITDHMEELVSGLQGPPGIPSRGRPGRPGPPGRIGHTGTRVRIGLLECLACMSSLYYPLLTRFEMSGLPWKFQVLMINFF